jgi:hypothetical protein
VGSERWGGRSPAPLDATGEWGSIWIKCRPPVPSRPPPTDVPFTAHTSFPNPNWMLSFPPICIQDVGPVTVVDTSEPSMVILERLAGSIDCHPRVRRVVGHRALFAELACVCVCVCVCVCA